MGRPKKEKYEIEERFQQEALLLAGRYSETVKERDQLRDLMAGNFEYTEDMATHDLLAEQSVMIRNGCRPVIFPTSPGKDCNPFG